jgi:hypothetical protein
MEITISITDAAHEQFHELIVFGSQYYPVNHHVINSDYLAWLYIRNPFGVAKLIKARCNGELVGLIAFIPIQLKSESICKKAYFAVNVLTHPEHRDKNLFIKMIMVAKETFRGHAWMLGHPNQAATPGWRRQKMNFRNSLIPHLAKFGGFNPICRIDKINDLTSLLSLSKDFWERIEVTEYYRIDYSAEFLNWRYLLAPHHEYHLTLVSFGGVNLGIRVSRPIRWGVQLLVDFVPLCNKTSKLLSTLRMPTLIMQPPAELLPKNFQKVSWRLPLNRQLPFFLTTLDLTDNYSSADFSLITLGASDL